MAIFSFRDQVSEDIAAGRTSKRAQRRLPPELHSKAHIKLARLAAASSLNDLTDLPGNRLEQLRGDRVGQLSIRINDQFRICFNWSGSDAYNVEIADYH